MFILSVNSDLIRKFNIENWQKSLSFGPWSILFRSCHQFAVTSFTSTSESTLPYTKTGQSSTKPPKATKLYLGCQSQHVKGPLILRFRLSISIVTPLMTSQRTGLPLSDGAKRYLESGLILAFSNKFSNWPPAYFLSSWSLFPLSWNRRIILSLHCTNMCLSTIWMERMASLSRSGWVTRFWNIKFPLSKLKILMYPLDSPMKTWSDLETVQQTG